MSIREEIANDLVKTLRKTTVPLRIKYVTREPFEFDKLSNAQYPAVLLKTSNEDREDSTLGGSMGSRHSVINFELSCYVKGSPLDSARNNMVETIESAIEVDRTRGGHAIDTQLVTVEADDGSIAPVGAVIITVKVVYSFIRGNT
jgi:hypothetical protein